MSLSYYFVLLLLTNIFNNVVIAGNCPDGTSSQGPCFPPDATGQCPADEVCTAYTSTNTFDCCLTTQMTGPGGGGVTTVNPAATTTAAPTSSCNDLGTDCPSRAYLCNNQLYYTLMTQQCPKTCNRCSGGGVGTGTGNGTNGTCTGAMLMYNAQVPVECFSDSNCAGTQYPYCLTGNGLNYKVCCSTSG